MKKLVFLFVLFCFLLLTSVFFGSPKALQIYLNGTQLNIEMPPFIKQGHAMVPLNLLSKELGYETSSNPAEGTAVLERADSIIKFTMNDLHMDVDGQQKTLEAAPFIKHGVVMVPLRMIADYFGLTLSWDSKGFKIELQQPSSVQTIENIGDEVYINYDLTETPQLHFVDNPPLLVIDLPNSVIKDSLNAEIPLQSKLIQKIDYTSIVGSPPAVQVTIHLTHAIKATLAQNQAGKQISIQLVDSVAPKYIVVIDAGHGGKDEGAESVSHRNEADFTLSVALKVQALMAAEPAIKLYMTREDDTFVELDDRVDMANKLPADLFLSIHANVNEDPKIEGTETYIYRTSSAAFGETIQKYVQEATGFPDRHVAYDEYRVIKNTTMPAALVEVGFVSNAAEDKALFEEAMQDKIAAAIVAGIKAYLSIP